MKKFFIGLFLCSNALAQQVDLVEGQKLVDQFLQDHEVISTTTYCRTDISTPECRMLMKYKNKKSNELVASFQMAFTAPFRQAAGTEFFLETASSGQFLRLIDSTVDKKVNIDAGGIYETVINDCNGKVIKGIKFGLVTGDLSFGKTEAKLVGELVSAQDPNVKTPVNLIYKFMNPIASPN